MRIIRGKYKTRRYSPPKNFPSRPITDFAKEALFNILENQLHLEGLRILDLCAGTGSVSLEFLSREAGTVMAVDNHRVCIRHLNSLRSELDCKDELTLVKSDVLKFVERTKESFDLIFADPPYAFQHHQKLVDLIFSRKLLAPSGWLIVEHGRDISFENRTHFEFCRKYGSVHFSFFNLEGHE